MSTRTLIAVVLFVVFVACSAVAQYPRPATPPGGVQQRDEPTTVSGNASQQPPDLALVGKLRADDGVAAAWWQVRLTAAYVLVTALLFLVAVGQLVAIARQAKAMQESLDLTRAQLKVTADGLAVAKQAAEAATKSASAAERTLYLTLRARIDVLRIAVAEFGAGQTPTAELVFVNSGGKPAHLIAQCVIIQITDQPWAVEPEYPQDAEWESSRNIAVRKGGEHGIRVRFDSPISAEAWERIETGTLKVRVYGAVRYNDGFGKTRTTKFGREYSPETTRVDGKQSFRLPPVGSYNNAD